MPLVLSIKYSTCMEIQGTPSTVKTPSANTNTVQQKGINDETKIKTENIDSEIK